MAARDRSWAREDLHTPTSAVQERRAQPPDQHLSQLRHGGWSHELRRAASFSRLSTWCRRAPAADFADSSWIAADPSPNVADSILERTHPMWELGRILGSSILPRGGGSLVLRRPCVRAYARGVTRVGGPRARAAVALALALLGWVVAPRSSPEHPLVASSPADAARIESVPTLLVTTSSRPVPPLHTRFGESQRALWVITVSVPAIGAPALASGRVHFSPSILSAGPVAHGLAGRGPPSSTDA
jgi:hypothetical protein